VVGDREIRADEVSQLVQLLGPVARVGHHLGPDAVNLDVEREEVGVTRGRPNEPLSTLDNLPISHTHQSHRARGGGVAVCGLKIDGGEVDWHTSRVAHSADIAPVSTVTRQVGARPAPPGRGLAYTRSPWLLLSAS